VATGTGTAVPVTISILLLILWHFSPFSVHGLPDFLPPG